MISKIVKYGAEWCEPCKKTSAALKEVLQSYPDISLVEYDADEDPTKFNEMGIRNIPQIFFYDAEGTEIHHLTGVYPANKLKDIIDYHNRDLVEYNPYNVEYGSKK